MTPTEGTPVARSLPDMLDWSLCRWRTRDHARRRVVPQAPAPGPSPELLHALLGIRVDRPLAPPPSHPTPAPRTPVATASPASPTARVRHLRRVK